MAMKETMMESMAESALNFELWESDGCFGCWLKTAAINWKKKSGQKKFSCVNFEISGEE